MIGYSSVAVASWASFTQCIDSPCNCLLDPKERKEYHPTFSGGVKEMDRDDLCTPWNKGGGRNNNTCLLMKKYPGTFILEYHNLCAEATPNSTYFNPRIKVRGQQCNAVACWTTSNTLDWDGDCVTLASGYGIFPLYRMCARVALPEILQQGAAGEIGYVEHVAADPGYTSGHHIDNTGTTQEDEKIIGIDGQVIDIEAPKLCLYADPAFISVSEGLSVDFMDLDPNHQPMHKTKDTHPVVEVILFFLDFAVSSANTLGDLISSLTNKIFGGKDGKSFTGTVIQKTLEFIGEVISWVGDEIAGWLREIGQINRAVDSKSYGCVNLPLGPMPPPFCEQVAPLFQVADVQDICKTGSDGLPVESLSNELCHVSTVPNNYIRNSVRIGYEDLVPLCKGVQDPNVTDKCINIQNLDVFSSAQSMHVATSRRDIIKHCGPSTGANEPCVESMNPHSCSVTSDGCEDGYRVVYGRNTGGIVTPQGYFQDDIDDCPSGSSTCQEIWGINRGEFQDISLTFPSKQTSSDTSPIAGSHDLTDRGGRVAHFSSSIVRVSTDNPDYEFRQEPKQICVFEGDFVVGCRDRAEIVRPNVYECDASPNPSVTCVSSYFSPQFIIAYTAGADSTTALIKPKAEYTSGGNDHINLAGNEFESFVTDDSFITKPFSGPKALNSTTRFGDYQDDATPLTITDLSGVAIGFTDLLPDSIVTKNEDAVYLGGLEYISGSYHLGGKHACLESYSYTKCPQNPKMCVKAKLLNRNEVRCTTFFEKSSENGGLNICFPSQTSSVCPPSGTIPKKNGGSIEIRDCGAAGKCYASAVELCQISYALSDRVDPSASLGRTLGDNQYFNTEYVGEYTNSPPASAVDYDRNLYGVRDKTPVELGLCVAIPQGTCPAENTYNADTGFASWPSVAVGEYSYGTCKEGKVPFGIQDDLVRRCVANPNTKSFNLEPVYRIEREPPFDLPTKIYPTNIKCVDP